MFRHSLPAGLALACMAFAGATPAHAVVETWVSGTGTDASNCPRSAPCRTFAYALTKTNSGGTINVAAPGSFGPVTITKSVSIVADGVEALINTAAGGAAITINAAASHIVSLRGLTIQGVAGSNGITFASGAALRVQNCVIRRGMNGITFQPASGTAELYVSDSVIADAGDIGLYVIPGGSAGARVVLDRVRVENAAGRGMHFEGNATTGVIRATVRKSVASGSGDAGILVSNEGGGGAVSAIIDRSTMANNLVGVHVDGPALILIGDSTVTGNGTGLLSEDGGVIGSYETNKIDGNDDNGQVPGTVNMQ